MILILNILVLFERDYGCLTPDINCHCPTYGVAPSCSIAGSFSPMDPGRLEWPMGTHCAAWREVCPRKRRDSPGVVYQENGGKSTAAHTDSR